MSVTGITLQGAQHWWHVESPRWRYDSVTDVSAYRPSSCSYLRGISEMVIPGTVLIGVAEPVLPYTIPSDPMNARLFALGRSYSVPVLLSINAFWSRAKTCVR